MAKETASSSVQSDASTSAIAIFPSRSLDSDGEAVALQLVLVMFGDLLRAGDDERAPFAPCSAHNVTGLVVREGRHNAHQGHDHIGDAVVVVLMQDEVVLKKRLNLGKRVCLGLRRSLDRKSTRL